MQIVSPYSLHGIDFVPCPWNVEIVCRYFSGHTRDATGNVEFKAGKTKVGTAINGAIKIVTVAVC